MLLVTAATGQLKVELAVTSARGSMPGDVTGRCRDRCADSQSLQAEIRMR